MSRHRMNRSRVKFRDSALYAKNTSEKENIKRLAATQAPFGAYSAVVVAGWHTSKSDPRWHLTVDYTINSVKVTRKHVLDDTPPSETYEPVAPLETARTQVNEEETAASDSCHCGRTTWELRPPWPSRDEYTTMHPENAWMALPVLPSKPRTMALITGRLVLAAEVAASRSRSLSC